MIDARVLDRSTVSGGWQLLRVSWPRAPAQPGQWLWLEQRGRRLCLPVRQASTAEGWLAAVLPPGRMPAALAAGTPVTLDGPHGEALLSLPPPGPVLVLGADAGVGPALAVAETPEVNVTLALLGARDSLPGRICPSRFLVDTVPAEAIAGLAGLEALDIPVRVALPGDHPGCFDGDAVSLLRHHLSALAPDRRAGLTLLAACPWGALTPWRHELEGLLAEVRISELPVAG